MSRKGRLTNIPVRAPQTNKQASKLADRQTDSTIRYVKQGSFNLWREGEGEVEEGVGALGKVVDVRLQVCVCVREREREKERERERERGRGGRPWEGS